MTREEKSETFRKEVQTLIDTGEAKNYIEIATAIGIGKAMMSNIINGRSPIPADKFKKFTEVYHVAIPAPTFVSTDLLRLDAKCDVILSTMAEILANQRGQPVAKIQSDLVGLVNSLIKARLIK